MNQVWVDTKKEFIIKIKLLGFSYESDPFTNKYWHPQYICFDNGIEMGIAIKGIQVHISTDLISGRAAHTSNVKLALPFIIEKLKELKNEQEK